MGTPDPTDEQRHAADDTELWNESYYLDWFSEDLSLGGYVRIGFYPNLDRVWYWACLVGPDRPLVTVIEHDIPMPRSATSLELRHSGLWADHVVETPNDHMSINLEAFALSVDDPAEVYRPEPRGERVPLGFELDFDTDRAATCGPRSPRATRSPAVSTARSSWGTSASSSTGGANGTTPGAPADWWSMGWSWTAGRLDDGTRWHSAGGFFPDNPWGVAYVLAPGSTDFAESDEVPDSRSTRSVRACRPATRTSFGDRTCTSSRSALSLVLLVHPDGREERFLAAMARVTDGATGRTGGGWIEWNQPPNRSIPQFPPVD